jgi:hypothetical protein
VLAESVVLGGIGGLVGALAAYAAFDGFQTSTMNFQTFSQVAFAFRSDARAVHHRSCLRAVHRLVGGLLPAIRAARLPNFESIAGDLGLIWNFRFDSFASNVRDSASPDSTPRREWPRNFLPA